MPETSKRRLTELREVLDYKPGTGLFHWKISTCGGSRLIRPGDVAGYVSSDSGYVLIGYTFNDGTRARPSRIRALYRAHRLAWWFMTGKMPREIDHKNGDRADNRWSNLRLATRSQNNMNMRSLRSDNRSGHRGVSWRKDTGKWHARIATKGKIILLGDYAAKEDAIAARRAAEVRYFGEHSGLLLHRRTS